MLQKSSLSYFCLDSKQLSDCTQFLLHFLKLKNFDFLFQTQFMHLKDFFLHLFKLHRWHNKDTNNRRFLKLHMHIANCRKSFEWLSIVLHLLLYSLSVCVCVCVCVCVSEERREGKEMANQELCDTLNSLDLMSSTL
jgi:hypothetical protein